MLYINKVTNDASQKIRLTGIPGVIINMNLRYLPRDQCWMMDLAYNNFAANGLVVTTSPNMIRQWRNIIPFGIACLMADGLDPYNVTDFADQSANLYLLDAADVQAIENGFFT